MVPARLNGKRDLLQPLQRLHLLRSAYMSLLPAYALDLETETIVVNPGPQESIASLSREFKRLHAQQGYYSGGAWNTDIDKWNCRKHAVMNELAGHILEAQCSFREVIKLMGQPDDVFQSDDPRAENFNKIDGFPSPDFCIQYYWRQDHDYLIFALLQNRVIHVDWVYAQYEQQVV